MSVSQTVLRFEHYGIRKVVARKDFSGSPYATDDRCNHGTHVAGIASAATIRGAGVAAGIQSVTRTTINAVTRAHAVGTVSVVVTKREGVVTAIVEDDGKGFGAHGGLGEGLGLVGMKERVGLLDGRLAIESTEGAGTTVVAEVPVR